MHTKTIQASAPGKLILLGEYAVLEQASCLVSAVQRECTVDINPLDDLWYNIDSSRSEVPNVEFMLTDEGDFRFKNGLSSRGHKRLRFVLQTIKYVVNQLDLAGNGASVYIDTDRFFHHPSEQKLGLGASAAITVSLLAGLVKFSGRHLTDQELYRQAFHTHRRAQGGLGSGMDIAASATGGLIEYQMHPDNTDCGRIKPIEWPDNLQMIPIWAGHSASTENMVQQVQAFRDASPKQYDAIMRPMKELSEAGCKAFTNADIDSFLDIISEFYAQEKKLGEASNADIISDVHRNIGTIVTNAGGSYKPSGAGGGDIGVAFCKSGETSLKVKQAIEKSRYDLLDLPLLMGEPA